MNRRDGSARPRVKVGLLRFVREVRRRGKVKILDRGKAVALQGPRDAPDHCAIREGLVGQDVLRRGKLGMLDLLD